METRSSIPRNTALVAVMLSALTLSTPAFAVDILDDPMQIDERLTQLLQTSNSLCWEMYRYHQQQPDYRDAYRATKDLWFQAARLRDLLWAGPVETNTLIQRVTELNESYLKIEAVLSKWGPGDRTSIAASNAPTVSTVVTPGIGVDVPFFGFHLGGGTQVVTIDDNPPQLQRRQLHPNSRGSKRSLERELAALKLSLSYLMEDSGMTMDLNSPAVKESPADSQFNGRPLPDPELEGAETIVPAKTPDSKSNP